MWFCTPDSENSRTSTISTVLYQRVNAVVLRIVYVMTVNCSTNFSLPQYKYDMYYILGNCNRVLVDASTCRTRGQVQCTVQKVAICSYYFYDSNDSMAKGNDVARGMPSAKSEYLHCHQSPSPFTRFLHTHTTVRRLTRTNAFRFHLSYSTPTHSTALEAFQILTSHIAHAFQVLSLHSPLSQRTHSLIGNCSTSRCVL